MHANSYLPGKNWADSARLTKVLIFCRIALFQEEEYEGAKEAFETAKGLGAMGDVDRWLGKCEAELEGGILSSRVPFHAHCNKPDGASVTITLYAIYLQGMFPHNDLSSSRLQSRRSSLHVERCLSPTAQQRQPPMVQQRKACQKL